MAVPVSQLRSTPSVSAEAASLVSRDGVLLEALSRGIVNYRALARWINRTYGVGASEEALVSAIRRLKKPGVENPFHRAREVISRSHLNVRSQACQITAPKSKAVQELLPRIFQQIDFARGEMLYYTQGETGTKIVVDESNLKPVQALLGPHLGKITRGLAALIVVEPEEGLQVPGILALLSTSLALHDINIVDAMWGYPEYIFFVREPDTLRAYEALQSLIASSAAGPASEAKEASRKAGRKTVVPHLPRPV